MPDPLTDPRVIAARARVTTVERVRERFAEPTAEVAASAKTASMRIYGRIDSDGAPWGISAQEVAQALDALPDDVTRLDVHIHSRGGDAFDGLAILNLLQQAKPEVHTHVDGLAASAASAIAMAGRTVTMAPSATMMIHDAAGIGVGQAADMRVLADALDSVSESYAAAYAAKTGTDAAKWRAAMVPETWYRADEAVAAKLADVRLDAAESEPKPTASLDLSIFAYAGRDNAPEPFMPTASQTPAGPPEAPPNNPEGADAMSDTIIAGLRERFGLADDADEATIQAALDAEAAELEQLKAAARPKPTPKPTEADPSAFLAALEASGKVVVSKDVIDELRISAKAGQDARAEQLRQDRDDTINAAVRNGHISPARKDHWTAQWNADAEGTREALAELSKGDPLFPIGAAPGAAGGLDIAEADYTDDMAAEDAAFFGLPKEALTA